MMAAYNAGKAHAARNGAPAREQCPFKPTQAKTVSALLEWSWVKGAYGEEIKLPEWAAGLDATSITDGERKALAS